MSAPTPWDASAPYPPVRRDDNFTETFKSATKGDVAVKDPYHWLHEPDSSETTAFVEAQGKFARAYLDQYADAGRFKEALTKNWNYARCE